MALGLQIFDVKRCTVEKPFRLTRILAVLCVAGGLI